MKSGVYKIEHISSGRVYIGSAVHIANRLFTHRAHLRKNKHSNAILQNAWNKYGEKQFHFQPLIVCSKESLVFYEQLIMDGFQSHNKSHGFNIRKKADSNIGIKPSQKNREALRQAWEKSIKYFPGFKYGKITIIDYIGVRKRHRIYKLKCECGKIYEGAIIPYRKSCGCHRSKMVVCCGKNVSFSEAARNLAVPSDMLYRYMKKNKCSHQDTINFFEKKGSYHVGNE